MHIAVRMLDLYIEYLDVPYSLHNRDRVAINNVAPSAMYNYGSITCLELALLCHGEYSLDDNKQRIVVFVAHESLHHWFDNLVPKEWWTYLWLNDDLAKWQSFWAVDSLFLDCEIWT